MLFQNYALFPHMTVTENIAFGLETRGIRRAAADERVAAGGCSWCSCRNTATACRHSWRAASNSASRWRGRWWSKPALLLLDERSGALDKALRQSMQVELRLAAPAQGYDRDGQRHDQDEALTMADRQS